MKKLFQLLIATALMQTSVLVFAFDHSYQTYDEILKNNVVINGHQSAVNYAAIKSNRTSLDAFVSSIEALDEKEFKSWSREQQMAFLINAYNAITIRLIIDNYPEIDSIKDLGGLFISSPWDKDIFTLFGQKRTLNHIEHIRLRKVYEEPRLHFVLVCASISCPPLRDEAYTPEKLDQQMTEAAHNYLQDTERNRFNVAENKLELSRIFKWFKKDFTKPAGSLNAYVAPYITDDPDLRNQIKDKKVKVSFLDYDWGLNDIK